jgi:hypothetical protein
MSRILLATTVRWPSATRLAAGFAALGVDVQSLVPRGHSLVASRHGQTHYTYHPFLPLHSLKAAIDASKPDLVVPCDDRAVALLLKLYDEGFATRLIERSLGKPENYSQLIARDGFIAAARAAGITAPDTIAIPDCAALEDALDEFGFSAVLKADGSWGGDGVQLVSDLDAARKAFDRLTRRPSSFRSFYRSIKRRDAHHIAALFKPWAPRISLQRYVTGTPATSAFACWRGRVLAAIHLDVVVARDGTGPACVVRRAESGAMDEACERLARTFGLSGLHGLDYIRDASGTVHLIEINPRATQTSYFALGQGHDLLAALVGAVTAAPREPRPLLTPKDLIALFPQEWLRDPESPWLETAYHDVPWDEPDLIKDFLVA